MALTVLGGIVCAVVARVVANELKAWSPWITQKLIKIAVSQLATLQQERFTEEWLSHINETPGDLTKIGVALGFLMAARNMNATTQNELRKRVYKPEPEATAHKTNAYLAIIQKAVREAVFNFMNVLTALALGSFLFVSGCTLNVIVSLSVPLLLARALIFPAHSFLDDLRAIYGPGSGLVRKGRHFLEKSSL
jgi:hypothetical protein